MARIERAECPDRLAPFGELSRALENIPPAFINLSKDRLMTEEDHRLAHLNIKTTADSQSITVTAGKAIYVLGRNGTGKSALVHDFVGQLRKVIYLPGARPSYFDNDSLSMTPASRQQYEQNTNSWYRQPQMRYKSFSGTVSNEKAIHDLQTTETQYKVDAANDISLNGIASAFIAKLQTGNSPLDRANHIFSKSNITAQLMIASGEIKAKRDNNVYSIARMSDGERMALIILSEVIAAPKASIFILDEPELHLHRAIIVPLIAALIAERPDCGFVISTHELDLPAEGIDSQIVLVRGCSWQGERVGTWDVDVIDWPGDIPEDIRVDVLGSRRVMLFIEGTNTSLDRPLYALLFPNISVRPRENCREVRRAVAGLRSIGSLHHASAFGIVDNDGMSSTEITNLEAEGIYALPTYSVESLYYSPEVMLAIAEQQAANLGEKAGELINAAKDAALSSLRAAGTLAHLASRLSERAIRDRLLNAMPSRQSLVADKLNDITVTIDSPYSAELAHLNSLVDAKDVDAIVKRYPVRESGMLKAMADGLRFRGRADYEKAVLTRVGADKNLQKILHRKFGSLTNNLS